MFYITKTKILKIELEMWLDGFEPSSFLGLTNAFPDKLQPRFQKFFNSFLLKGKSKKISKKKKRKNEMKIINNKLLIC